MLEIALLLVVFGLSTALIGAWAGLRWAGAEFVRTAKEADLTKDQVAAIVKAFER